MKNLIVLAISSLLFFVACTDNDQVVPNNEDTITTSRSSVEYDFISVTDQGVTTTYQYDPNADTLVNAAVALGGISTLEIVDTDGDGDGDEGIRKFPGDQVYNNENETGGRNVGCLLSESHCYTSRFTIPEGNQGSSNGGGN